MIFFCQGAPSVSVVPPGPKLALNGPAARSFAVSTEQRQFRALTSNQRERLQLAF